MTEIRHVSLSDDTRVLVSEYVCGLLKPEERPHVHMLLSRDDDALTQALAWEMELLSLVDALPRVQPSSAVRERLQRSLGIGPPPAPQPPSSPQLLKKPSVPPVRATPAPEPTGMAPGQATPVTKAATMAKPSAAATPATKTAAAAATSNAAASTLASATTGNAAATAKSVAHDAAKTNSTPAASPAPRQTATKASLGPRANKQTPTGITHKALMRKLWVWRLLGISATVAAVVAFMLPGEPPPPPVQIVKVAPTRAAILQAPGTTSTPGWTATLGPEGNLRMRPLVHTEVPAGSQILLWTRSAKIPEPRLLGRIDPNLPVQVPAAQLGAIADDQLLEITLETDEDAAAAVPNGPVLFIGQMTVFGSEGAAAHAGEAAQSAVSGPITQ